MSRIARTVSTIAVVVATAGLIAPAAQAKADGLYPRFAPGEHAGVTVGSFPLPTAQSHRGPWLEHNALVSSGDQAKGQVAGRFISTSGGTDWTFPAMGAVAIVLVAMIFGEQVLVRRRRLAT